MKENHTQLLKKTLGDVPVHVHCQIGNAEMEVKDIMNLKEKSVISLGLLVGEPVDISIAGKIMAKGEVVILNENYGVRLSEVL